MSVEGLAAGDTVVFKDAYTGETKYGRVERGYGSTFVLHIVPREKAGPNPKLLKVSQPCTLVRALGGARICGSHQIALAECELHGEENPSGVGHLRAWACAVSGKQFLEAEDL
jgi:hypothetical protein